MTHLLGVGVQAHSPVSSKSDKMELNARTATIIARKGDEYDVALELLSLQIWAIARRGVQCCDLISRGGMIQHFVPRERHGTCSMTLTSSG